jgi:hypothetical protein
MGVQTPHDSYSLKEWGEIAEKLQVNAAKKLSQLSLGNGGGIQQVNGQYFVNGEQMSLSQVNFCVRANQYQLIDQQIADQMDAIQRNNDKAKQIQAVLAAFKTYDNENIGVNQSATTNFNVMMNSGDGGWGVVQHYLNTNFDVTATTDPDYEAYSNMLSSGYYSADITFNSEVKSNLSRITLAAGSSPWNANNYANGEAILGTSGAYESLARYIGLTPPATYEAIKTKLATIAPTFRPPNYPEDWNTSTLTNLGNALDARKTALIAGVDSTKQDGMKTKLTEFFTLLKGADSTFYEDHVTDTNGGPPYKFIGEISNTEFTSLKTNFGTYLSSNSTDNQVAQQRLEALNNSRQAILDGMSAFTQGQSQVTDRIGGNL